MKARAAGFIVALAVITVGGIVALATGHDRSGLTALVIGGAWAAGVVLTIAGRARRRRRSGGPYSEHAPNDLRYP
jgi:hypothetical protein